MSHDIKGKPIFGITIEWVRERSSLLSVVTTYGAVLFAIHLIFAEIVLQYELVIVHVILISSEVLVLR